EVHELQYVHARIHALSNRVAANAKLVSAGNFPSQRLTGVPRRGNAKSTVRVVGHRFGDSNTQSCCEAFGSVSKLTTRPAVASTADRTAGSGRARTAGLHRHQQAGRPPGTDVQNACAVPCDSRTCSVPPPLTTVFRCSWPLLEPPVLPSCAALATVGAP